MPLPRAPNSGRAPLPAGLETDGGDWKWFVVCLPLPLDAPAGPRYAVRVG